MAGMGVLHLEIATSLLQEAGLDITTSQPLINYRETIRTKAGPIMSKSPNRHNKIFHACRLTWRRYNWNDKDWPN